MNIRQAFKMAWKSIWGKKGRSTLTILGIFIGIAAVMTIVSVMEGMQRQAMEQFEAMGSNKITIEVSSFLYDEEGHNLGRDYFPDVYDYCKQIPHLVRGVTPRGYCQASVTYGTVQSDTLEPVWDEKGHLSSGSIPPDLFYAGDQFSTCENLKIAKGRDLSALDIEKENRVCVMSAFAAKIFFGSGSPVGKEVQVNGHPFQVVGVYAPRIDPTQESAMWMDNLIIFPYSVQRLLGGDKPTSFRALAVSSETSAEAVTRIKGFLRGVVGTEGNVEVYSDDEMQSSSNDFLKMGGLVLGGIAAISLLVGGIGIMNIMLVTVTERTREIGIRRAIGAQRSSIVAQFLIEAGMLCGIGGILGILVGTFGSVVLSTLLVKTTIYPSLQVALVAFGFSVLLGVVFGSYPAIKASKLQPVEALRAE